MRAPVVTNAIRSATPGMAGVRFAPKARAAQIICAAVLTFPSFVGLKPFCPCTRLMAMTLAMMMASRERTITVSHFGIRTATVSAKERATNAEPSSILSARGSRIAAERRLLLVVARDEPVEGVGHRREHEHDYRRLEMTVEGGATKDPGGIHPQDGELVWKPEDRFGHSRVDSSVDA